MGAHCQGICIRNSHSLYHWKKKGYLKCSVCRVSYDDHGQVYCSCCSKKLARALTSTPEKMKLSVIRNQRWRKRTQAGLV